MSECTSALHAWASGSNVQVLYACDRMAGVLFDVCLSDESVSACVLTCALFIEKTSSKGQIKAPRPEALATVVDERTRLVCAGAASNGVGTVRDEEQCLYMEGSRRPPPRHSC